MRRRSIAAFAASLVFFSACGGDPQIPSVADRPDPAGERSITLPEPVAATPVYVATLKEPLSEHELKEVGKLKGVAVASPVTIKKALVEGPRGVKALRIAEVEPLGFRSLAPLSTQNADFVWVSLILGQAVPTFDAAEKLGLGGGGEITIKGTPGFAVGAFADNGIPNLADIMVIRGEERKLNLGEPTTLVVGATAGVTVEALGRDLKKQLPGARLRRLIPQAQAPARTSTPVAPQPIGQVSGGVVGAMSFEILPDGFIRPDPAWVTANIATAPVPILGNVTCHRLLIPRLHGALADVAEAGLADELRPNDYGGCYVPRFIDRDPKKPLSYHAFGLAVDLNVSTNALGTRGDLDPRIVEIFQSWGFNWGGHWSRPDPMHFELST